MKMIEIKQVRKAYGNREVLHGIDLSVEKGSIHGLVGRNGYGKTTLIKCMTGIYQADKGEVLICGEEVFENPKVKAQIGYVADSNHYFEGYHMDEIIDLYETMYPTFSKEDFLSYNQCVGLPMNRRIRELSKGQSMSLALMLNLAIHPKVMILDEPLSGLDVIIQKQIKDFIITEVEMNQMTVFISSHNLNDLESFCDSVTMLKDGQVSCQGNMDEVKEKIVKIQAAFSDGMPGDFTQLKGVITYSNVGSVYTIIFKGDATVLKEELLEMGAAFVEEIPLSLEEVFIYSNQEV